MGKSWGWVDPKMGVGGGGGGGRKKIGGGGGGGGGGNPFQSNFGATKDT